LANLWLGLGSKTVLRINLTCSHGYVYMDPQLAKN
jgi:hypothetical protein